MVKLMGELAKLSQRTGRQRQFSAAHYRMLRSYVPGPYPGRIVFFRAEEWSFTLLGDQGLEPAEIWAQVAAGGVEVRSVPGSHWSLINKENLKVLAAELKDCLDEAVSRCTRLEPEAVPPPRSDRALA
jgi:thioesterase domain-containing protein